MADDKYRFEKSGIAAAKSHHAEGLVNLKVRALTKGY
jgi:hypothetical protein